MVDNDDEAMTAQDEEKQYGKFGKAGHFNLVKRTLIYTINRYWERAHLIQIEKERITLGAQLDVHYDGGYSRSLSEGVYEIHPDLCIVVKAPKKKDGAHGYGASETAELFIIECETTATNTTATNIPGQAESENVHSLPVGTERQGEEARRLQRPMVLRHEQRRCRSRGAGEWRMTLINPRSNLMGWAEDGSEIDKEAIGAFKRARDENKMVVRYERGGRTRYRIYNHRKRATRKQLKARAAFTKAAKDGRLLKMRIAAKLRPSDTKPFKL